MAMRLGAVLHGLAQLRAGGEHRGPRDDHPDVQRPAEPAGGHPGRRRRQHAAQGGSYGALASSMGVTRATAQYRRDALVKKDPSAMEQWATGS
ncbi:hypothetical protein [Streptomyces sp. NPDC057557]|uniref:hypothetical protein n=1 Tax=Streptomyces sp. NPDC057557 TaxID=3346167 RepID=UPI00369541E6